MADVLTDVVMNTWEMTIRRLDEIFLPLDDAGLQKQIAPGRNRIIYLLGHLTASHDRLIALLGIGERRYEELDVYLNAPDGKNPDPLSAAKLKDAWNEVNQLLTVKLKEFSTQDWMSKHTAVSAEDFAKTPSRNRLAAFTLRTSHAWYHQGQLTLTK
jgi:uncharacterized damage-inducible protein DinB